MSAGSSSVLLLCFCILLSLHAIVTAHTTPSTSTSSVMSTSATNEYNTSFARSMLNYAGAAYCPGAVVSEWTCSFCKEQPKFTPYGVVYNQTTDMLAYVGYVNETDSILISFRGTSPLSILDWLEDLNFFQTSALCDACEVHQGFYEAYLSVRDPAVKLVKEITAIYPQTNIIITGHSLGGALTYVAAMDLFNEGIVATTLYTFGAPRVGNKIFIDQFNRNFVNATNYRLTHGLDPVPHLPPRAFDFYHPPTEVYWDGLNTNFKICDGSGEDPTCADQWLLPVGVTDHVTYLGLDFVAEFLKCNL